MNSAPEVKRTPAGKTRNIMINGEGIRDYIMTQDCTQENDAVDDDALINAIYDNKNKVRERKTLGISRSNIVSYFDAIRSKSIDFVPFKHTVNECGENYQWLSSIDRKQSINRERTPFRRHFELEDIDDSDDWRYNATSQPKFDIDCFQEEKSDSRNGYYDLVSGYHGSNDEAEKSLLNRYNDETAKSWFNRCNDGETKAWFNAVANSAKSEEASQSSDCYRPQNNDILLGLMIEKSRAPANQRRCSIDYKRRCSIDFNRRCSIDSLIQAVEIGEIDPFEPTLY